MTSTSSTWSDLFHTNPRTPASALYTEEAILNEELTADQVIEKALSSASLFMDMLESAAKEQHPSTNTLTDNDVIQTLHEECKELSDYLTERIWNDAGYGQDNPYDQGNRTSSSSAVVNKTADEEAQIAAFITCNDQIQLALTRYTETQDYLRALELQEEERQRAAAYDRTMNVESLEAQDDDEEEAISSGAPKYKRNNLDRNRDLFRKVLERDLVGYNSQPKEARVDMRYTLDDLYADDEDEDDDDEQGEVVGGEMSKSAEGTTRKRTPEPHGNHLRRSEQPLIWQLDPREDFKANKMKNKKYMDQAERDRIHGARHEERRALMGALMGPQILPEMLSLDDAVKEDEEEGDQEVEEGEESLEQKEHTEGSLSTTVATTADVEPLESAAESMTWVDQAAENQDDQGHMSDDSWEEIPSQSFSNNNNDPSVSSPLSSSTSSFLVTSNTPPSPVLAPQV